MNPKVLVIMAIITLIVVLVIGGRLILKKRSVNPMASPNPAVSEGNPCLAVLAEYKSQCNQLNSWLDQKIVEWKPSEYKPMDFAAYHTLASFPNVRNTNPDLLESYTVGLEESGADTIVIYMNGTPFLKNDAAIITKWNAVTAKIKADGKKLYIAYIPDVKGSDLKNWETYKTVETSTIEEIMKKYSPDSFVVLNEPSTIERELSFKPTADQWAALASDSADLVRSLNPKTKINIQITGNDLPYFNSLIKGKNIDGVGFNIYGFRAFDIFTPHIAYVKNAGKTPMLTETWKMFKDNQKYEGMDAMDAKWVRVAVYYAQANGMSYVNPFFTFYFFLSPADVRNQSAFLDKLGSSIASGSRTKSFIEYQDIINEAKGIQKVESYASPEDLCKSASVEYKAQCIQANTWLDQKLVEWKPASYKPMKFNGHLLFASEEMIDVTNSEIDAQFLALMNELNTDTLSLFIYPDMFEKHKARYEEMISNIRSAKKKLYVAYMVGGGSKFVKFSDFEEYRKTELDFTKMFIENYHPDYYVVVDEITTMERRTGLKVSDEDWGGLVLETVNLVKSINPKTVTVATGHSQELGFIKALTVIENLDMVGLNIWGIDQIDGNTKISKDIKDTVSYAKSKNKGVVFEQTWALLHDAPEAKKLSVLDIMKEPDAKYIKVLAYYANQNNVDIYSPFYIGKFVEYSVDPVKYKSALDNRSRTPVFHAYKEVINEFKAK